MTTHAQTYTAELLGTLVVTFLGSLAIVATGGNVLASALAFGLAWAGMWWVFGHLSGGHFHPAITIASVVARRTDARDLVPYVVSQAVGGILAAALLLGVLSGAPSAAGGLGDTPLAASLAAATATGWSATSLILMELVLSAVLVLVWLAATERTAAAGITGMAIGLSYAGILLAGLATTWSALNPVRTLGPFVLQRATEMGMTGLVSLWVGPVLGALVGAGLWIAVVQPARAAAPATQGAEA